MSDWRGKLAAAYTRAGFGEAAHQQRLAQMSQQQGGRWVIVGAEPLSASQHILHLLLTVFTAGLWAPVWIIRAMQGEQKTGLGTRAAAGAARAAAASRQFLRA